MFFRIISLFVEIYFLHFLLFNVSIELKFEIDEFVNIHSFLLKNRFRSNLSSKDRITEECVLNIDITEQIYVLQRNTSNERTCLVGD